MVWKLKSFSSPQDDEEFPGLSPAPKGNQRFSGSIGAAKQCSEVHGRFHCLLH